MRRIFKAVEDFFKAEKPSYSHRDRTIEIIALERGVDIDSIKADVKAIIEKDGRVAAIEHLRSRFHINLSAAWRYVDKLDV